VVRQLTTLCSLPMGNSNACRHVQQPAAVVEVFAGVWPLLQAALGLYGREPRPAERLCKVRGENFLVHFVIHNANKFLSNLGLCGCKPAPSACARCVVFFVCIMRMAAVAVRAAVRVFSCYARRSS